MSEKINTTLQKIYELIGQGSFPKIKIPERGTKNIIYGEKTRQYILGDKTKTRSLGAVSQSKLFSLSLFILYKNNHELALQEQQINCRFALPEKCIENYL